MQLFLFIVVCLYLSYYCIAMAYHVTKKDGNLIGGIAILCVNIFLVIATILLHIMQ
ncbi:hypothetical protein SAMN04488134_10731 [Amphibacillus marinus]|uniref:Uncharacterized protein n=1 Tax=Amphibacillus marinus TaxID=872970 RepID=A0A1H8PDA2_9BACI|nr:hypothetical protein [Amphibacillus marinus]SEO39737.1 hypothetical protein SAMN04488134_10731 [Amphibacillus marinus]